MNEGEELWIVAVATTDDGSVEARFPGGAVDTMATVGRQAVLAARWPDDARGAAEAAIEVTVRDGTGAAVTELEVPATPINEVPPPHPCDGASEPPPLPPPGEQPADPAAAEAAVRAVVTSAFTRGGDASDVLVDGAAIDDEQAELDAAGYNEPEYDASLVVDEVVFTAPDAAAVAFTIDSANYPDYRYTGGAVLVDGEWRVTNETWCEIIGPTGVTCD
jgi:hypothetical protein